MRARHGPALIWLPRASQGAARAIRACLLALWLGLTALPALAQTPADPIILSWETVSQGEVTGDPQAPSLPATVNTDPVGDGITGTDDLSRVGAEWNQGNHTFNSKTWPTGYDDDFYLTWGFTSDRPYRLTEMLLRVRRSNTGPGFFRVYMRVGSDPPEEILAEQTLPGQGINAFTLITISMDHVVQGNVQFFLYAYGANSAGGTFTVRNEARTAQPQPAADHAIVIRGDFAEAELEAEKDVMVFSEDGSGCNDPAATPPTEPEHPAAIPGACVQYTITVRNTGPVAAQAINLTDALPASLTLVNAFRNDWDDTNPDFAFNTGCSGGTCGVEVQNGIIPANTTATITIRATIN